MKARDLATSALEWCNKLSPGEAPSDDLVAFCVRRLNDIIDEWSANALFLAMDLTTSSNQSGNITLGQGAWAEIPLGATLIAASSDGLPLAELSTTAYNTLSDNSVSGTPQTYTYDGVSMVRLYPVPTGQVIRLQTRSGLSLFADFDTDYPAPPGYKAALGSTLALRLAPVLLGGIPPALERINRGHMMAIKSPRPALLDSLGFQRTNGSGAGVLLGGGGNGNGSFDVLNGNTP